MSSALVCKAEYKRTHRNCEVRGKERDGAMADEASGLVVSMEVVDDITQVLIVMQIDHRSVSALNPCTSVDLLSRSSIRRAARMAYRERRGRR